MFGKGYKEIKIDTEKAFEIRSTQGTTTIRKYNYKINKQFEFWW